MKTLVMALIVTFISINAFALNSSANAADAISKKISTGSFLKLQNPGTGTPTTFDKLPQKVQDAYNTKYKGSKVKGAWVIESKGNKKYEIQYLNGKTAHKIFYDENGNKAK